MNRLRSSPTVCSAPRVTRWRVSRRPVLNAYHRQGNHDVTTQITLPVQGNDIRFAPNFLEGVRQVNLDQGVKTVEGDGDPALIALDVIRRAFDNIEYRAVAS